MATAVKIPVDSSGDQQQEVASDEETIRRLESAKQDMHGRRVSEEFPKLTHGYIYPDPIGVPSGTTRWHRDAESQAVTATRCDRKVQIGCTKIENLDQLSDLGVTEMDDSVIPKYTKRFWKFKSMTNRGLQVLLTQSGSNLT